MSSKLFIISGPSASGKNTVLDIVLKACPDSIRAITYTTRAPRSNETDGVDYYFVSEPEFEMMVSEGRLVEHNNFNGNNYGLSRDEIARVLSLGKKSVFAILDVNGEKNVKKEYPDAVSVFIMPPSMDALRSRIEGRKENTSEQISGRLAIAENEISESERYDYKLVNADKDDCAEKLIGIISKY